MIEKVAKLQQEVEAIYRDARDPRLQSVLLGLLSKLVVLRMVVERLAVEALKEASDDRR